MEIRLRPGVTFHDGSAVTAPVIVKILTGALPLLMGPAFADIDRITATSDYRIQDQL